MQIETIFGLVLWSVGAVVLLVFLIALAVGKRTQDWTKPGGAIALLCLLLFLVLYGAAAVARAKIGDVATFVAGRIVWALDAALIGGFATGRKVGMRSAAAAGVCVLATVAIAAGSLWQFAGRGGDIVAILKRLGVSTSHQRPPSDIVVDCRGNLKHIFDAMAAYAQDWDAYPPAENWMTAVQDQEMFKEHPDWKRDWFHCPLAPTGQAGYAFNSALAGRKLNGKPLGGMPNAATTPLVYDSSDPANNAHDAYASLPKPGRHDGGDNVVYCDGHVEPVTPR